MNFIRTYGIMLLLCLTCSFWSNPDQHSECKKTLWKAWTC